MMNIKDKSDEERLAEGYYKKYQVKSIRDRYHLRY